ncbi:MAG TPA: hypothetical protein VIC71_04240 [Gammaproteobacteria bacterium]|jgi:hypothetical protein
MRIVTALLSLSLPCVLNAADFDYTFVDAGLVDTEIDVGSVDVSGDGIGINGSIGVSDNLHIVAGYNDLDYDFGISGSTWNVGLGFNTDINDDLDFVADVTWIDAEVDTAFGSASEDGYGVSGGIRAHVGEKVELDAGLQYVDLDESDTVLNVGGRYYFSDSFALNAGLSDADAGMSWMIGIRAEFGGR